jgi:hypothetical protein
MGDASSTSQSFGLSITTNSFCIRNDIECFATCRDAIVSHPRKRFLHGDIKCQLSFDHLLFQISGRFIRGIGCVLWPQFQIDESSVIILFGIVANFSI